MRQFVDQDVAALSRQHPIQGMIQNIEDQVGRRPVTEREIRDQRKNSPYMLMAYVLARHANAADWFNGVTIGSRQTLEFHHIFPKGLLRDHYDLREDSRTVDQVANLAFLSSRANSRISNGNPAEYLQKIDPQRLTAQNVPLESDLWHIDQFEEFLLRRRTMLADAINALLLSLTDKPSLWPISNVEILESRVDAVERRLRETINDAISEVRGDSAWESCIPKAIQSNIQHRIEERLSKNPFESGNYDTLLHRLELCQFSDYPKIVKVNWSLFADTFGSEAVFDQHVRAVTDARNAYIIVH